MNSSSMSTADTESADDDQSCNSQNPPLVYVDSMIVDSSAHMIVIEFATTTKTSIATALASPVSPSRETTDVLPTTKTTKEPVDDNQDISFCPPRAGCCCSCPNGWKGAMAIVLVCVSHLLCTLSLQGYSACDHTPTTGYDENTHSWNDDDDDTTTLLLWQSVRLVHAMASIMGWICLMGTCFLSCYTFHNICFIIWSIECLVIMTFYGFVISVILGSNSCHYESFTVDGGVFLARFIIGIFGWLVSTFVFLSFLTTNNGEEPSSSPSSFSSLPPPRSETKRSASCYITIAALCLSFLIVLANVLVISL